MKTRQPVHGLVCLSLLFICTKAGGQEAPTGFHYAGRASDTGAGGNSISVSGAFTGSVPLRLPLERTGTPIPLQVVYTTRGVGAAGLGWDIPLSYIQRDRTLAHRRPIYAPGSGPTARERAEISLLGQSAELIQDGTSWVARIGTKSLSVRQSGANFVAYDGTGRTYTFTQPGTLTGTGRWLLQRIESSGKARVELRYLITGVSLNGGIGLEISLTRISYNTSPSLPCPKHLVTLSYNPPSSTPLSIMPIYEGLILGRARTLHEINVQARASCFAPLRSLRRYEFTYEPDADTGVLRLQRVQARGRSGTPEAGQALPVASFSYGSATNASPTPGKRQLNYALAQIIPLPLDDAQADRATGETITDATVSGEGGGERYALWNDLIDMDGDGRPDLMYQMNGVLAMARNLPADGGTTTLLTPSVPLHDAVYSGGPLSTHTTSHRRLWYGSANMNVLNVWRQVIDVDGDGRLDIIDAAEEEGHWVIYLNTPNGPNGIKWKRRSVSVASLAAELKSRHHLLDGNFVPLSRRVTGVSVKAWWCVQKSSDENRWTILEGGWVNIEDADHHTHSFACAGGHPLLPPPDSSLPPPPACDHDGNCPPPNGVEPEQTFVEWQLTDLNGDGYPDFVFNSRPADFFFTEFLDNTSPPEGANEWVVKSIGRFRLPQDTTVLAAYNFGGVHLGQNELHLFADPVVLDVPSSADETGRVADGVEHWVGLVDSLDPGHSYQAEVAGFVDVNGDGLSDRATSDRVYLGLGTRFSTAYIQLPQFGSPHSRSFVAIQRSNQRVACANSTEFTSDLGQGLRDLTGDGIPDFVYGVWRDGPGHPHADWQAAIGTGVGYVATDDAVGIVTSGDAAHAAVDFVFSHQSETCDGTRSSTDGGVVDLDGDGRPDLLSLVADNGHRAMTVSQLTSASSPRVPEAGRLTAWDNGFGARTEIRYRSAKEDLHSTHAVPFQEIVVTAVSTATQGLGTPLAGTRYAYGRAKMIFDVLADRFVFPGYQRVVAVHLYDGERGNPEGAATITDTWSLEDFSLGLCTGLSDAQCKQARWQRVLKAGHARDILALRGTSETDPWQFLDIDDSDSRIIGIQHFEWDARHFELSGGGPNAGNFHECIEMVQPYDFDWSAAYAIGTGKLNPCAAHGFLYASTATLWYGGSPPPASNNVQTKSTVLTVDDFGHITSARFDNDLFRLDDDICVENQYAVPIFSHRPPVLNALATRRLVNCDGRGIYRSDTYFYDGLPAGQVASGRVTAHEFDRRNTATGDLIKTIRRFEATYDASGNLVSMTSRRDGAERRTVINYDPFGLAPTGVTVTAAGSPAMTQSVNRDPLSLQALGITDTNGVTRGMTFDGFERPVQTTLSVPGGVSGITSTIRYLGDAGADPLGRRITVTEYSDPVKESALASAAARLSTLFVDELGRPRFGEVALGTDYGNETLIVRARRFDSAGRIAFQADPYPKSQDGAAVYGASLFYNNTGEVDCIIRGQGPQVFNPTTDATHERYPTCFKESFDNHQEFRDVYSASALQVNSAQSGVYYRTTQSAVGWRLADSTCNDPGCAGAARLAHVDYYHDHLGRITGLRRYRNPAVPNDGVTSLLRRDSDGNVLDLSEPEAAQRFYDYSDWDELVSTHWTDAGDEHRLESRFDGLGRLVHSDERINGVVDPETVRDFSYDSAMPVAPHLIPTFVAGRLARATGPHGSTTLSYDALGRVSAEAFADDEGGLYVDRALYHHNGQLASIEFDLPDHAYQPEVVKYEYDSASRLRSVTAPNGSSAAILYRANTVDPLGRVRKATYGADTVFSALYSPTGRQLIQEVTVRSTSGSRRWRFTPFDAQGRETSREEFANDALNLAPTFSQYNAEDELAAVRRQGGTAPVAWGFEYDPLGNLLSLKDSINMDATSISYRTDDRDRICRIEYSSSLTGSECNVTYDALGNITREPTPTGSQQFDYFPGGAVRTVTDGTSTARFGYDSVGGLQKLDIESSNSAWRRHDRFYGSLLASREVGQGANVAQQILRKIPGPGGIFATRGGPEGDSVFGFGEFRGNRFFTNYSGQFIQDIAYQPYGRAWSSGAGPGSADYTSFQWNGGSTLEAFGLSRLGARLYAPAIGRFLNRDPLLFARGAVGSNPYAFAANDPINAADPSGLDSCSQVDSCSISYSYEPDSVGEAVAATAIAEFGPHFVRGFLRGFFGADAGSGPPPLAPSLQAELNAAPETSEGRFIRNLMIENEGFEAGSDEPNWDALAKTGYEYDDLVDRVFSKHGTWYPPHEGANAGFNLLGSVGAGAGDAATFGGTRLIRNRLFGGFSSVDESSGGYFVGGVAALFIPFGEITDLVFASREAEAVGAVPRAALGCSGGICGGPGVCFAAGTPVATETGRVPIEDVKLGDRVSTQGQDCASDHLPVDAVTISLDIPNPVEPQDIIHIEVARSRRWATEQGIAEGATVPIDLPEIGIHGTASVIAVRPAPREQSGTGCLVTSRITHVADQLLSVRLSSGSELSLTPAHRLFIEGRGWTPAGEMKAGESLRADRGEVRVLGILPGARNKPVYNLEVAMAHSYRVGTDEVWAHNQCPILERLGSDEALHQSYVRLAERVRFLEEDGSIVNAQFTRALKSLEKGKIDVDSLMNTLIRQAHYYYKNGNLRVVEFQDLERIILAFPELP